MAHAFSIKPEDAVELLRLGIKSFSRFRYVLRFETGYVWFSLNYGPCHGPGPKIGPNKTGKKACLGPKFPKNFLGQPDFLGAKTLGKHVSPGPGPGPRSVVRDLGEPQN